MAHRFFVSARYCRFSLSAWSKMKNFDPDHKSKVVYLLKINDFAFMVWVKIFHFWPCWKWKSIISCRKTNKQCVKLKNVMNQENQILNNSSPKRDLSRVFPQTIMSRMSNDGQILRCSTRIWVCNRRRQGAEQFEEEGCKSFALTEKTFVALY